MLRMLNLSTDLTKLKVKDYFSIIIGDYRAIQKIKLPFLNTTSDFFDASRSISDQYSKISSDSLFPERKSRSDELKEMVARIEIYKGAFYVLSLKESDVCINKLKEINFVVPDNKEKLLKELEKSIISLSRKISDLIAEIKLTSKTDAPKVESKDLTKQLLILRKNGIMIDGNSTVEEYIVGCNILNEEFKALKKHHKK